MQFWRTKEWLNEHYNKQQLSWPQIAAIVGRTANAVRFAAASFGIQSRSMRDVRLMVHKEITKDILKQLYEMDGLSISDIARKMFVSPSIIQARLKLFELNVRTNLEGQIAKTNYKGKIPRIIWADKDWLTTAYENMSIAEIASTTGWSCCRISEIMDSLCVKRRDSSSAALMKSVEISDRVKHNWQTLEFQNKMAKVFAARPKVSGIQEILYSTLSDLGVVYYREHNDKSDDPECQIDRYLFDCVIPRAGKPTLLIECQGDYYHNRRGAQERDRQKYIDIITKFPGQYEIKQIWEHEFYCESRVSNQLRYWLGLDEIANFDFNDVVVAAIERTQAKQFFGQYHYLGGIGHRGTIIYGAMIGDKLIAAAAFSPLIRQNIPTNGYSYNAVREISRSCIHPQYHKKNFASWFITKCLKLLPPQFKMIVAYSDATYNHTGTIYKACGFKQDKVVSPDYWYNDDSGNKIHKKTLYNHAVSSKMIESEFANKFGYSKVYGSHKYRFVLER